MAVAAAAAKPSRPPPVARTVVALLVFVRFVLAPVLAFGRVVRVPARAVLYLSYAVVWVFAAASAAKVVAARAWGKGSAPSVFLQALTDAVFKVFLCGAFLFLAGALKHDSTRAPRTAVLGAAASLPFMLLLFTGSLMEVMMSSPVEGSISKGERIGSVIVDVGVVGSNAISCFVIIPALALGTWRNDKSDRKAGLTV